MPFGGVERSVARLDVVVLGGAAMDWVAEVESLPPADGLALAHTFTRHPGGSAANVAVGLARLGYRVAFAGKVGDDEPGRLLCQAFEQEGVDTELMRVEAGRPTATCFIALDARGQRVVFSLPGASLFETAAEMDPGWMRGARVLYLGPAYVHVAAAATEIAHEEGVTIFYAPGSGWGPEGLSILRPILDVADVLLVSQAEATALAGDATPEDALRTLVATGVPVVVETLGAHGVVVATGKRSFRVPALAVTGVRDTTGAGDAFAAGLVAGFLDGLGWEASARLGSVVAALKVRYLGARNGLPVRGEVESFMAQFQEGGET
jgi:ribokinase